MNKKIFIAILFLMSNISISVSQNKIYKDIYEAHINNDLKLWKAAVDRCEKRTNYNNESDVLELIHYYYGYASSLIGQKRHSEANDIIEKSNRLIEKTLDKEPRNALMLNYKGVFGGYEVAINKMKALTLGPKSIKLIDDAYKLKPKHIQILFDKGNTLYYTPSLFGGNKTEALLYYGKARKIIEQNNNTKYNWIYLQILFVEAHSIELNNELNEAKKRYEYILKLEPNFLLVKNKYYPNLLKKLNKQ